MAIDIAPDQLQKDVIVDKTTGGGLANVDLLFTPSPKWCDSRGPAQADAFLAGGAVEGDVWLMRNACGFFKAGKSNILMPSWILVAFGNKPGWIVELVVVWPIYYVLMAMDASLKYGVKKCEHKGIARLVIKQGVKHIIQKWVGPSIEVEPSPTQLTINYACPTVIASPDTFVSLWLTSEMDEGTVKQWNRANGWCEYTSELVMKQSQYHFGVGDIIQQWQKG